MAQISETFVNIDAINYASIGTNGTVKRAVLAFNQTTAPTSSTSGANYYISDAPELIGYISTTFGNWNIVSGATSDGKYPYRPMTEAGGSTEKTLTNTELDIGLSHNDFTGTLTTSLGEAEITPSSWVYGIIPYSNCGFPDSTEVYYAEFTKLGLLLYFEDNSSNTTLYQLHICCAANISNNESAYPRYMYETISLKYLTKLESSSTTTPEYAQFTFSTTTTESILTNGFNYVQFCDYDSSNTTAPYTLIAVRSLGYTIPFKPSSSDTSITSVAIRVKVSDEYTFVLDFDVIYTNDYTDHAEQTSWTPSTDPHKAWSTTMNVVQTFPALAAATRQSLTYNDGTGGHPNAQVSTNHSYSYLQWYYWNENAITSTLANSDWGMTAFQLGDFEGPFLGFNDQFGSYLYSYAIKNGTMVIIIAGSNQYYHLDFYRCDVPSNNWPSGNLPTEHYNKILINRWFNNLYFVYGKKCWMINVDPANMKINHGTYIDVSETHDNYLESDERLFVGADNANLAINEYTLTEQSHTSITEFYQPTFSDMGDCIIGWDPTDKKAYIVGLISNNDVTSDTYTEQVVELKTTTDTNISTLFNNYMIESATSQKLLSAMYILSAWHIKFLLERGYDITYIGSRFTIGSRVENETTTYLLLFKTFETPHRIRFTESYIDNLHTINDTHFVFKTNDTIKEAAVEDVPSNPSTETTVNGDYLVTDRHCVICKHGSYPGYYRWMKSESSEVAQ